MSIPPQQAVCNMINPIDTECFIRMEDLRLAPFSLRNGDTLSGRVVAFNFFGYSEPSNTAQVQLKYVSEETVVVDGELEIYPNQWLYVGLGISFGFFLISSIFMCMMCCCRNGVWSCFENCKRPPYWCFMYCKCLACFEICWPRIIIKRRVIENKKVIDLYPEPQVVITEKPKPKPVEVVVKAAPPPPPSPPPQPPKKVFSRCV